jgi:hypothetical protein
MNLFIQLLFGHFVGDFFLQNKQTAVKKGGSYSIALAHVAIYTLAIMAFTLPYGTVGTGYFVKHINQYLLFWSCATFIPHFIIDRFSLADVWLRLIDGRALGDFLWNGNNNIPAYLPKEKIVTELTTDNELNYLILRGGFSCIVYVVVDNIAHLMCLWYGWQMIFGSNP